MLTLAPALRHTPAVTSPEETLRDLQEKVDRLQAQLDALAAQLPTHAHPPEVVAWAQRHGIDLDEFVPYPDMPPGTFTMSVAEAARDLRLSEEQVRRHLRSGRLEGVPLGGRAGWRVSRFAVTQMRLDREGLPRALGNSAPHPAPTA